MSNIVQLTIDTIRMTIEKRIVQLKTELELSNTVHDIVGKYKAEGAIEELEFFLKHLPKEEE